MTSQISDADPSELSDLLDVDGAPLLSLTDPSRCLPPVCCCWRCVILLNVERIFEEFGVTFFGLVASSEDFFLEEV